MPRVSKNTSRTSDPSSDFLKCKAILESQIGPEPKIDFAKFQRILGYGSKASARDSYHRFRARLRGDIHYGDTKARDRARRERVRQKLADLGELEDSVGGDDEFSGDDGGQVTSPEEESGSGDMRKKSASEGGRQGVSKRNKGKEKEVVGKDKEEGKLDDDDDDVVLIKAEVKREPEIWYWD